MVCFKKNHGVPPKFCFKEESTYKKKKKPNNVPVVFGGLQVGAFYENLEMHFKNKETPRDTPPVKE